jgi:hypothetical protein
MPVKEFLVSFESDDRTRWLYADSEFLKTLATVCSAAAGSHTDGSRRKCPFRSGASISTKLTTT